MTDNANTALGSSQRNGHFPLEECEGWELFRRHLELSEGFSFAIITAPDDWGVAHLREELPALLPSPNAWKHLVFDPSQPPESLAELLLSLPIPPPETKVLWLDAEPGTPDQLPNRDEAWSHALARLNRYRNTLSARLPCALLLAIPVRILPILRASAPDFWAIRSGLFRIEPPGITGSNFEWIEPRETAPQVVTGDYRQTLDEADKLRGKPGRELILADILHRAGRQARSALQWREAERALQEAYTLLQDYGADPQERVRLALALGSLFEDEANFERSEFYMRRALAEADQHLGKNHPLTATALNNLASLLQETNRLAEAEPLVRRALEIDEKSFGSHHPEVAGLLNNLAQLLQDTNRLAEAESLMRRALEIDERSFGSHHPEVAGLLNNLALLLKDTNRLAEAEPLMRRALEIDEKTFGSNHPNVARGLNNLALLLKDTNRLAEAEPLMRRALEIVEKSLGSNPPTVATHLNNLASLLQATNRLAEAEPLMRRALEIDERSFGSHHPEVATDLNNFATLLQETNRLAEAEPLMRRALEIDENSFGFHHPRVATDLNNLALLLQATNRLAEAEPLMRRALEIDEKSFDSHHPAVANRLNNLALLLQATNRLAEAEPLMRRALEIILLSQNHRGRPLREAQILSANYRAILFDMQWSPERVDEEIEKLTLDCKRAIEEEHR